MDVARRAPLTEPEPIAPPVLPRRVLNALERIRLNAANANTRLADVTECLGVIFPSHDAMCDRAIASIRRVATRGLSGAGISPDECRQILAWCEVYVEHDTLEDATVLVDALPAAVEAHDSTRPIPADVEGIETGQRMNGRRGSR
jgi:hypothetical protein